jgi:hypothetical protein
MSCCPFGLIGYTLFRRNNPLPMCPVRTIAWVGSGGPLHELPTISSGLILLRFRGAPVAPPARQLIWPSGVNRDAYRPRCLGAAGVLMGRAHRMGNATRGAL